MLLHTLTYLISIIGVAFSKVYLTIEASNYEPSSTVEIPGNIKTTFVLDQGACRKSNSKFDVSLTWNYPPKNGELHFYENQEKKKRGEPFAIVKALETTYMLPPICELKNEEHNEYVVKVKKPANSIFLGAQSVIDFKFEETETKKKVVRLGIGEINKND
ncbi:hypothetical protein ROZALSC1DRAFT_28619 [Rozella allomycis CSF55]|uniref:Uncharacterized protein n=1 Tax=Rozella allomycis (strain CSF55) TaxID=988480 RepID=A0A075AZ74_ROZAC|nr:hypothetical protein O9G_003982 [Rozella allomycis CSF55]RKP19830.1 hypothetical protein ROZALSC1DRAFT_28619 [Rozella allomycis CSF55]|eukprot:EPZ33874.1 hypothetical protein O9G_003982 [Rozella allomycis CSF55]